jgi:hypothetical protein
LLEERCAEREPDSARHSKAKSEKSARQFANMPPARTTSRSAGTAVIWRQQAEAPNLPARTAESAAEKGSCFSAACCLGGTASDQYVLQFAIGCSLPALSAYRVRLPFLAGKI